MLLASAGAPGCAHALQFTRSDHPTLASRRDRGALRAHTLRRIGAGSGARVAQRGVRPMIASALAVAAGRPDARADVSGSAELVSALVGALTFGIASDTVIGPMLGSHG